FSQFNSALHTPEEIRTQRDKPMRRIPVSNTTHEAVDAKDLLQHDDTWSIPTRRQGKIAVELAAIERLDCDHGSTDYTDSSNTDNNPCKSALINPSNLWPSFPSPTLYPQCRHLGSCTCDSGVRF